MSALLCSSQGEGDFWITADPPETQTTSGVGGQHSWRGPPCLSLGYSCREDQFLTIQWPWPSEEASVATYSWSFYWLLYDMEVLESWLHFLACSGLNLTLDDGQILHGER